MLKFFAKLVLLMFAVAMGRFGYEKVIDLPPFALKEIDLSGDCDISKDSVLTISGLQTGKSIYKQNLKFALSRLSHQPSVVECSIDRGYLSGIDIEINMAEPALLIKGGGLYCLSREGIVLPFDSDTPVLPIVTGRKFSGIKINDRLRDPDIIYSLRLYETMMAHSPGLCARLSEINFSYDSQIRIYLSPKGTVAVLSKRRFDEAVLRLAALQDKGLLEGQKIFDLRFGPVAVESSLTKGIL